MPEVTVKYKNEKALKALQELAKKFDIVIQKQLGDNLSQSDEQSLDPPITFAENPDIKALAGIWQGREITLEDLRKQSWGNRL
jgi:hypothetical protein